MNVLPLEKKRLLNIHGYGCCGYSPARVEVHGCECNRREQHRVEWLRPVRDWRVVRAVAHHNAAVDRHKRGERCRHERQAPQLGC